jgi:hypothetical protein
MLSRLARSSVAPVSRALPAMRSLSAAQRGEDVRLYMFVVCNGFGGECGGLVVEC